MATSALVNYEENTKRNADHARSQLSDFAGRAVQILQELAEFAENDRVRMAAVNSILDRAGVTAPTEVKITATPEEHALIRQDAEDTLAKLERNIAHRTIGATPVSLEALVVHEGDDEPEVLAIASTSEAT